MIFEELILHNFGIYKGRHTIALSPKSEKKPIILFGGLNGGGKTTFLDALQLTLYGKHARCSNRNNLSYTDYLREAINRHTPPQEGAALELSFSSYIDGELNTYQVKRFWRCTGKTIKEEMEVIHNGQLDTVMTEQWYEYVDEFIPLSISGLFFFDGEKIETLADPEGSADLIRTGITSLLGLDIVDKLGSDLNALLRTGISQPKKAKSTAKTQEDLIKQEAETKELKSRIDSLNSNLASTSALIDNLERSVSTYEEKYRNAGGELFDQRKDMEGKLDSIKTSIEEKESRLRKYAEGIAPLSLVENLVWKSLEQAKKEQEGREIKLFLEKTETRDQNIIKHLKDSDVDSSSIKLLEAKIKQENSAQKKRIPKDFYLDTPIEAFSAISADAFNEIKKSSKMLIEELDVLEEQKILAERRLSSVPEEAILADIQQELERLRDELTQEKAKRSILNDQVEIVKRQLELAQIRLVNLKQADTDNTFDAEINQNITANVNSVKTVLEKFHQAMVKKHVKHLESLIFDSFISLIRKSDLVKRIKIEAETYKITLLNQNLEAIPPNRLSAGERQILAISILWGLAKASGRPLPSIIDTPLGRLDSKHRKQLIKNYFPMASHQVILLSTDQEIDKSYRDDLSKYIGREYHIEYQESLKTSTITEGYF